MTISRRALLGLVVVLAGTVPAAAQTPAEINFGILSTESQQNLKNRYTQFLADMEQSIGMKVNAFFASDYAGVIEAMRFGKVQIALYGNASAIIAVDRSGGEVFAATLDEGGNDGYYSHVIVHHDSPLRDFNDLLQSPARYSFANGDPNSTSGYLVPGYYAWALNKIDVRRHFTKVVAGNHEANALAVAGRQVDVATCNSESLRRLQGTLPAQHASLRVIWTSPLIPLNPAVWRTDLSPAVKEKVRAFMTDYGVERSGKPAERLTHERSTLETMKAGGFRPSSNKQLIPLRQIALYRDRVNAENDDRLSAAEKTAKLREIDAKLSQLDRDIGS